MSWLWVSNSRPGVRRKSGMIAHELRQMCSPDDGSAVRDGAKRGKAVDGGEQDVQARLFVRRSSPRSHRSCVHTELPLIFSTSTLFLDKPLFISFIEFDARTVEEPVLFRSTLSVRLGVSSRNQPIRRDEGQVAPRGQQAGGHTLQPKVPACEGTSKADDPDPWRHGNAPGLSALGRPNPSNAKAGEQKESADEFRRGSLPPNRDPGMNFITSPLK